MAGALRVSISAPPIASGDARWLRAVDAVEQALGIALGGDAAGPPGRGELAPLSNGDDAQLVSLSVVALPARVAPAGQPALEVQLRIPEDAPFLARVVDAVAALGTALEATWGSATTEHSRLAIGSQTVHHPGKRPLLGLPALVPPALLPHPAVPHRIGWINYWSAATAARLGVIDSPPGQRARRLDNGAWVWRLTDEPLDLRRADHLQALVRAYERFGAVGGREG